MESSRCLALGHLGTVVLISQPGTGFRSTRHLATYLCPYAHRPSASTTTQPSDTSHVCNAPSQPTRMQLCSQAGIKGTAHTCIALFSLRGAAARIRMRWGGGSRRSKKVLRPRGPPHWTTAPLCSFLQCVRCYVMGRGRWSSQTLSGHSWHRRRA
jgi:hypothetical protein